MGFGKDLLVLIGVLPIPRPRFDKKIRDETAEKSKAQKSMNAECILTINKINYEDLKNVLDDLKNVTNAKIKEGKIELGQLKGEFI